MEGLFSSHLLIHWRTHHLFLFSCSTQIAAPVLDQRRKVAEEIDNDRQLAVQAALVRIMKSRKKLGHQQLIAEVVTQLQKMFSADIKLVKRSIEQLIDVSVGVPFLLIGRVVIVRPLVETLSCRGSFWNGAQMTPPSTCTWLEFLERSPDDLWPGTRLEGLCHLLED